VTLVIVLSSGAKPSKLEMRATAVRAEASSNIGRVAMSNVIQGAKWGAVALAAALTLGFSMQAQAATGKAGGGSLLSGTGGAASNLGAGSQSTQVINVAGIISYGEEGDSQNITRSINIGPGSTVVGIGWDVGVTAVSPSWLSELQVSFGGATGARSLYLTVGVGSNASGTQAYSSGGVVDLVDLNLSFAVGADGVLKLEFLEAFDDQVVPYDGIWNSGNLTIEVLAVPEPSTYGLMALGLLAVGAAARRRVR
jgi:PEP-CTERM motif